MCDAYYLVELQYVETWWAVQVNHSVCKSSQPVHPTVFSSPDLNTDVNTDILFYTDIRAFEKYPVLVLRNSMLSAVQVWRACKEVHNIRSASYEGVSIISCTGVTICTAVIIARWNGR
jgi:hypothetical protein